MSIQMAICPKCAWFKARRKCDFCNIQMIPTETTVEESMSMSDKQKKELINFYIETLIKDTYDPKAREYQEANRQSVFADYVPDTKPTCPTCKSTNIEKISVGKKVFGGAMFGLFSSDVRKTMHCKNCGYKW